MQLVSQFCCDTSCRDGVTLSNSRVARPVNKIEQISSSRNDGSNKKAEWNVSGRVCYSGQFFVQLVTRQNCETGCTKNFPVNRGFTGIICIGRPLSDHHKNCFEFLG